MNLLLPLVVFLVGLFLSALFSGTETGFYRVSRLRLEIGAQTGDVIARLLSWFAERPALFISTVLVGNNVANYIVSFAAVVLVQEVFHASPGAVEILATLVAAPVVFIFGELVPKRLFLQVPYRLLRIGGPIFFMFAVILLPISLILWAYSRLLTFLVRASIEEARSEIASRELGRILEEGEHAGVIVPIQRRIARAILEQGTRTVKEWMTPLSAFPAVSADATWRQIADASSPFSRQYVLVYYDSTRNHLLGYAWVPEFIFNPDARAGQLAQPILRVRKNERLISVLRRLFQGRHPLALVVDEHGHGLGVLEESSLRRIYLHGENTFPKT